MNKNVSKIIMGVAILVVIIIVGMLVKNNNEEDNTNNNTNAVSETVEDTSDLSVSAIIDNGDTTTSYDKKVSSGTTALELMNLISTDDGIVLGTTEYDFGTIIDSIDGVGDDTEDGKYWSFYVNDELSSVGIGDYPVNDNDSILMKYQAL